MALPKKYRLRRLQDFDQVKKNGQLYSHPWLGILVFKQEKTGPSQFGFLISTKFDRLAVGRNRIKRLLSEVVFSFLTQVKPGFKVVFLPRQSLKEKPFLKIKKAVEKLFKEANLLK